MDLLDGESRQKKPPTGRRGAKKPDRIERRSSLNTGSDIANAIMISTRHMRNISKALRESESELDTYGELEFIRDNRKELLSALPTMVKGHNICPNEEFVIDAIREYQNIQARFTEILDVFASNPESIPLKAVVEASGKQLSLIGVALTHYMADTRISADARFARMIPRIHAFIDETFQSLQLIIDASSEPCIVTNGAFFGFLGRSFFQLSQFFDELETVVQKSILAYARDVLIASLKRISAFCQPFEGLSRIAAVDLPAELERVGAAVAALTESAGQSDLAICSELVREALAHADLTDPCFLFDLERMTAMVESIYVTTHARPSEAALVEIVRLRCHLMLSHSTASPRESDATLCDRLKDVEDNLNDLVAVLQTECGLSGLRVLHELGPKWRDSLHRAILGIADVRAMAGIIRAYPQLYAHVERYLAALADALAFFEVPRGVDVSHVYFDLVDRLADATDYARRAQYRAREQRRRAPESAFTRVSAGRALPDEGAFVARVVEVLHRTFIPARSTSYCGELALLIVDAHLNLAGEEFEAALERLVPPGTDAEALSEFARAKLAVLLALLNLLAKLAEVEMRVLMDVRVHKQFRSAEAALEGFKAALTRVIDGEVLDLPSEARTFESLREALRPFYAEMGKIARRVVELTADEPGDFDATEEAIDALRYIAKTGMPQESVAVLFERYEVEFKARNTPGFVEHFVRFFQRASYVPLLRGRAVELKDELIGLLQSVVERRLHASNLDRVIGLNTKVDRRIRLLDAEDVAVLKGILASELCEFVPPMTDGPAKWVAQNVCWLVGIFLNGKQGGELSKVREMAVTFEQMTDLCRHEIASMDDATKHKSWEVINKALTLVPPDGMGAFPPKMDLLLFLLQTQSSS
jgi:hypothetical protein